MEKTHYTAQEAAIAIFMKASPMVACRYMKKLYEAGELLTSTKIGTRWAISKEDIDRIKPRILSGELIITSAK